MQFSHNHQPFDDFNATIALEPPTKKELECFFTQHANKIAMNLGIAIKSDKDSFIKKIGREVAEKRLNFHVFDFNGVSQEGTKHLYRFSTKNVQHNNKTLYLEILLTTVAESDNVRFISSQLIKECNYDACD